jgi:hypothetical protein
VLLGPYGGEGLGPIEMTMEWAASIKYGHDIATTHPKVKRAKARSVDRNSCTSSLAISVVRLAVGCI